MHRLFTTSIVLVAIIAIGIIAWQTLNTSQPLPLPQLSNQIISLQERLISTPPPLKGSLNKKAGHLTVTGVLSETNRHRALDNLPALAGNTHLNQAAQKKLQDIFTQQYFDHVGPDGRGPSDWVDDVSYDYIAVGENLALGNFANNVELVQAWMDSPGHRENILNTSFSEIGIAVGTGTFEGHQTWLAVQTFAKPSTDCPTPPNISSYEADVTTVQNSHQELADKKSELDTLSTEIKSLANQGNAKVNQGNEKIKQGNTAAQQGDNEKAEQLWAVGEALQETGQQLHQQAQAKQSELEDLNDTYNTRVKQINNLAKTIQTQGEALNRQIRTYNACIN